MSARLLRIVERLELAPGDRLLEVGCGPGVAATYACARVGPGGQVTAVDRSATAVTQASKRLAGEIAAGRVEVLRRDLEDLDLGDRTFDVVLAVRVGLFRRDPDRAHALVAPWLAPGGRVVAIFDPPA